MTIASESIKAGPFAGNNSTTTFAFTFKCFSSDGADLKVVLTNSSGVDTTLTITTDYSVSLNANQDTNPGGSITTTGSSSPPDTGEKLTILNEPAYTQGTDLITGGGFYPDVVETALDRSTVLARRAKEQVSRSVQIPVSDSAGTTVELPSNTLRANKALVFDADGDVGVSVDNYVDQATASAASAATASAAATAAQSAASAVAVPFLMDTGSTTMADPAGTNFRLNHATVSSVSLIAFGDTSEDGVDVTDYLMTWDDSTSTINGHLILVQEGTPANWAVFTVGAMTDNSDWVQCAVTYVDSGGSLFTNDVTVRCQFIRAGDKGDTGNTGAGAGLEMTFESTTTDTDQGAGKIWLNHGTASSATVLYMDDVDANAININSLVDSWDDSTNLDLRGTIIVKKQLAPENYHIFNVTGVVTSASTYSKIAVTHVVSAGTISDTHAVDVQFVRSGDKGATGATGTGSSGFSYQFETATTDADQGAGKIWLNHGTVASATILYIDDDDNDGTDISAFTATWDDSSATTDKGFIKIQSRATPTDYAVFKISSSGTDGTAYWKFPVTHLVSAGTFSDTEAIDVFFTRSGDSGGVANRTVDTMTGDGSDDTLTLSQDPSNENNVTITLDGVTQHHDTFSLSGTTVTFSTAPALGVKVEAVSGGRENIGTPSDNTVSLAKMQANSIDSDQYVDASIDAAHLAVGKDGALSLDATPDTDHTANGPQTSTLASGYSSTIMDLVYLNANGKWLEADADATGTSINLLGIALEAKTDTQAMNVALSGSFVRDDTWNWTIGVPLYVSGTIGEITATKPTGTGDVVRTVGYAVTADVIFFAPSSDYVTLA